MKKPTQWMKTVMEQFEKGKQTDKEFSLSDAMKKAGPIHELWKKQNKMGPVSNGGGFTKTQKLKKCISKCVTKNRCKTKRRGRKGKKVTETTPNAMPEETPAETPEETPAETPEETPAETPDETPAETPDETPAETQEETGAETVEAPKSTAGGKKQKKTKKNKK